MSRAKKIFVEQDEDIIFTIEKVVNSEENRVIVVVPQNAALTSSAVSLKILSRQISKSEKNIVLVTDSEVGSRLGEKADIAIVDKVSSVTSDVWTNAKSLKEKMIHERDRIKNELLGVRKEDVSGGSKEENVAVDSVAQIEEPQVEQVKAKIIDDEEEEKEVIVPAPEKPRLPAKVVELNGITLLAGGDIEDRPDLIAFAKYEEEQAFVSSISGEGEKHDLTQTLEEMQTEEEEDDKDDDPPKDKFLGKDISNFADPNERVHSRLDKIKKSRDKTPQFTAKLQPIIKVLTKGNTLSNVIKVVLVLVFLLFTYSYFFLSKVEVNLVFSESEVRISEQVTASAAATEVDLATLTIPAIQLTKESSVSADGTASGTGETGETAQGLVDIINKKSEQVTLPAGKVITDISTQLNYVLQEAVTIPKEDKVSDISIKAQKFGENYNVEDEATFKIEGFETDDVIGYSFFDISGGTTEETTVVSQTDIDALKADLEEQLKSDLLNRLNELISDADILLEGSEKYQEVSFNTSVGANEEADTFSMDLKMSVTAKKVLKDDLKLIAQEIVRINQESSEDATIEVEDPVIANISIDGDNVTFNLSTNAGVLEDVSTDSIKEEIKGKSVGDAREYLRTLEDIDDFTLKYKPSFIPFFMQKVPKDIEKIEVNKTTETAEN
ncbi:hypothetical protein KC909_05485 [Candidatus Dojkabacteria bacterium]|uniref:Baseplate protein J-like domain-containing protein n=1 Tax=Candidatus Dojkabacteria bacterium TaxID=2099670 RepID=A0A955L6J9_9BACT|nr:hypothetical protein [Candidatus Dojkabacteria bacterium]